MRKATRNGLRPKDEAASGRQPPAAGRRVYQADDKVRPLSRIANRLIKRFACPGGPRATRTALPPRGAQRDRPAGGFGGCHAGKACTAAQAFLRRSSAKDARLSAIGLP